ncbi:MAG TPA: hypothetical protein DGG95_08470 [Cytophagales bacterium]|jgi:hypothetical protein|nr:hypothetical protein [Cytophagales bacterium]
MTDNKIEPGDVVKLSGAPNLLMTVDHISGNDVTCIWFDAELHTITHKFSLSALVLVKKKGL